ncbi:MAG: hypothetical protein IJ551_09475 [Prevotella sp.]|nr:hypothetical protein [Prevotella sp.]
MGTKPLNLLGAARNPKGMTLDELEQRVAQCSGFVKLMTGVANNAAICIARDCHDQLKKHPRYRQRVKQLFKAAIIDEYRRYRSNLTHPRQDTVCFFHLSDMPDETRRKYGAVTDADYFEFWEGTGSLAYDKSRPLVGSLWNKFRKSMEAHDVPHADIVAWGLVGAAVLELAVTVWQRAMRSVHEACEGILTMEQVEKIYAPFCLLRLSAAWQRGLKELAPETATYDLDDDEERNVALGVEQLQELWVSADLPFDATIRAVEDYADDIFSTKGHAKKAIRELSEMRNNAVRELEENKNQ